MQMRPIQIVGGGLAGLSLGVVLRQLGAPVSVVEAGRYPRHRVCGEFVSGRGRMLLREWGLEEKFVGRGAREARTAAFYSKRARGVARALPEPALCLSRFQMDECLAEEFRALGGELAENARWRGEYGAGVVRATGRISAASGGAWRWFGLKVHAHRVRLEADLEMHLLGNSYVGLCRLNDDTVNVCGLFRTRAATPNLARNWRHFFEGPEGSTLRNRLEKAEFAEDSFCATAGLALEPRRAADRDECCVGDAITMIAPLTGNGMSMAFESAQMASGHLFDYSRGRASWAEARQRVAQSCDAAFRRRLFWGRQLQRAMFLPALGDGAVRLGARGGLFWRQLFSRTR
jgi:flavin-dependent dehydrogenase